MSRDKIDLLKAYGAEVVVTPTSVSPDSPESYNGVADRLSDSINSVRELRILYPSRNSTQHKLYIHLTDITLLNARKFVSDIGH